MAEPITKPMAKNSSDALSIDEFQSFIHERYYQTDSARGTPATFMWFMEEVGELATALQNVNKSRADNAQAESNPGKPSDHRENLEEEFADVLAWLCTLANINQVDLTQALQKKYLTGDGPKGHK